jgi:hypothetical protein
MVTRTTKKGKGGVELQEKGKEYLHFLLNNQPDALIIPILFCHKTGTS